MKRRCLVAHVPFLRICSRGWHRRSVALTRHGRRGRSTVMSKVAEPMIPGSTVPHSYGASSICWVLRTTHNRLLRSWWMRFAAYKGGPLSGAGHGNVFVTSMVGAHVMPGDTPPHFSNVSWTLQRMLHTRLSCMPPHRSCNSMCETCSNSETNGMAFGTSFATKMEVRATPPGTIPVCCEGSWMLSLRRQMGMLTQRTSLANRRERVSSAYGPQSPPEAVMLVTPGRICLPGSRICREHQDRLLRRGTIFVIARVRVHATQAGTPLTSFMLSSGL
mmetsp:Transcript_96663/g.191638  ORF Transcript_96663/g.191638 Transcript_96663/m.191638 type:complete len:275 (+) Transcript_96663:1009-1833(+)